MVPQIVYPSEIYRTKLRWALVLWAVVALLCCLSLAVPIGWSKGGNALYWSVFISVLVNLAWFIPGWFLADAYHRSLEYQIMEDKVIVRAGIVTKSVKYVPYRAVTNIDIKRGPLDRWLGTGTLHIQTAGMSGTAGAEASLVGLADVQTVYQQVVAALRRYRGPMPSTATGEEEAPPVGEAVLGQILAEVRAIRKELARRP